MMASSDLAWAAEALLARYRSAPAVETEAGIALLALWALDAVEAGRLPPVEADAVFTMLDVEISEAKDGPELSETADQLLFEGMLFHDWGTPYAAEPDLVRRLAFGILGAPA